MEDRATHTKWL